MASYEDRIRRLEGSLARASLAMSASSMSSGRGGAAGGGTSGHAGPSGGVRSAGTQRAASLPPSSPVMAAIAAGQLPPPLALSGSTLEEAVAAGALSPTVRDDRAFCCCQTLTVYLLWYYFCKFSLSSQCLWVQRSVAHPMLHYSYSFSVGDEQ